MFFCGILDKYIVYSPGIVGGILFHINIVKVDFAIHLSNCEQCAILKASNFIRMFLCFEEEYFIVEVPVFPVVFNLQIHKSNINNIQI